MARSGTFGLCARPGNGRTADSAVQKGALPHIDRAWDLFKGWWTAVELT